MPRSDRSRDVAAVGAAIATIVTLIGTLVFTYNLGDSSGRIVAQAESYAAAYPYRTSKQIADCWRNPNRDAATKCVSDAINSSHEAQRSEADLATQRQMSVWAFWALVVSSISAVVTAIGTILLYQQIVLTREAVEDTGRATDAMREANKIADEGLRLQKSAQNKDRLRGRVEAIRTRQALNHARESNDLAKVTAERQLRPYVYVCEETIDIPHFHTLTSTVLSKTAIVKILFKNFGQTPAKNVRVFARGFIADYNESVKIPKIFEDGDEAVYPDTPQEQIHWFDPIKINGVALAHDELSNGTKAIYVDGRIEYTGIDSAVHQTDFRFVCVETSYQNGKLVVAWDGNSST